MDHTDLSYDELASAFPVAFRYNARLAISTFPATRILCGSFSVKVAAEVVKLPTRIHNDPALISLEYLTDPQKEFGDCLLTRHTDGFVRERHLARILNSKNVWVPPFVVQLVGEYVIEILRLIQQNVKNLDSALYAGYFVPPYYDSMVAKLIVHAPTRPDAINRLRRALDEFAILGIQTTLPLHRRIVDDPGFQDGDYTIHWLEQFVARSG